MNVNIRGFNFIINNPNSIWVWSGYESWDPYTPSWIEKNKGLNKFWDVGAWIGPYTLLASKLYNSVIAFEPDFVALQVLNEHIRDNNIKNVTTVKEGLYNKEAIVNFGFIGGKYGDSLSSINHPSPISHKIKTTSISTAIELYGRPDFIKIDIEGGEEYLIEDLVKQKFNKMCMSNHGPYMKNRKLYEETLNKYLVPLYDCYNIKNEKVDFIPDDGDFYYELKN